MVIIQIMMVMEIKYVPNVLVLVQHVVHKIYAHHVLLINIFKMDNVLDVILHVRLVKEQDRANVLHVHRIINI